jgi:pilus assembly protein CpaB
MKSRLIAGVAAILLAIIGGMLVFTYAGNADDRAVAELQPVDVLVVQKPVPAGVAVEQLGEHLTLETLPGAAVTASALKDLKTSAGKVTATALVPGEQLLAERLIAPEDVPAPTAVDVPKGLQEVSFQLEPQRVVGGKVIPGDRVGIFISMAEGGLRDSPGETTQLALSKVLVTGMQRAPQPAMEDGTENPEALPEGTMLVTVAVDDRTAQKIVFASEFGRLWLSKQPDDAEESKTKVLQGPEVYR